MLEKHNYLLFKVGFISNGESPVQGVVGWAHVLLGFLERIPERVLCNGRIAHDVVPQHVYNTMVKYPFYA